MASLQLKIGLLSSIIVGSAAYALSAFNQDPLEALANDTVFANNEAFIVMPVNGSINGVISEFGISPDSRFVHAIRYDQPKTPIESVWGQESQRRKSPHYLEFLDRERDQVFRVLDLKNFRPEFRVEWTAEPGVLILQTDTPTKLPSGEEDSIISIWRVSALDRNARELIRINPSDLGLDQLIGVSPNGRFFFTSRHEYTMVKDRPTFKSMSVRKFDLQGKLIGEAISNISGYEFSFLEDGETPVVHTMARTTPQVEGAPPPKILNLAADFAKRAFVSVPSEDVRYWEPQDEQFLTFSNSPHLLQKGAQKAKINALWLEAVGESERPRAFLDVNPSQTVQPQVAPNMSFVAYVVKGSLQVRPLLRMDMEAYKKAEAVAIQNAVMSQAKQMGVAINIYMADYDDFLPLSQGFKDAVMPYVKNESLFDGFVYTRPDGTGNSLEHDPGKTIIGYIQTPFGRAVVRLDSSVVWEPNKP